jgi:flagellar biogenesis protein FliO
MKGTILGKGMDATQKPVLARFAAGLAKLLAGVRLAASHVRVRRTERSLRVCESLAIGERRFLLVVQCDRRRYLIGAAAQTVTLLDRLDEPRDPALDEISSEQIAWKGLH